MSEITFSRKYLEGTDIFRIFATDYDVMLMRKQILAFSFLALMMAAVPASVWSAVTITPALEQSIDDNISIAVSGQTVTICGAQGETLEIVSLTGRRVMTVKIESPAQRIELNIPKGCYILKIGKVVRKVSVH